MLNKRHENQSLFIDLVNQFRGKQLPVKNILTKVPISYSTIRTYVVTANKGLSLKDPRRIVFHERDGHLTVPENPVLDVQRYSNPAPKLASFRDK